MKDALAERPLPKRALLGLVLLLILAVAPHLWHLNPLITLFFLIMAGWRLTGLWQPRWQPGRVTILMLMLLGLANVALNSNIADGREGGVSLLVAMLGLKLLEVRSRRDVYVSVFLGYFLGVTQFLFDQQMAVTLYVILVVLGLTSVLNQMNRVDTAVPASLALRESGLMLIAAVPAMMVMFTLFPRLGGPLWGLEVGTGAAITGVSDHITPGSISHLSESRQVAFRVDFLGADTPAPNRRYWRGPTLWTTDGHEWHRAETRSPVPPQILPRGPALRYDMTLEPTHQQWLFALDVPARLPPDARLTADLEMVADRPLRERLTIEGSAHVDFALPDLDAESRALGLQLPDNVTPRMRALAQRWRAAAANPGDIVLRALAHFNKENFVYTLQPPIVDDNPADQFLFETRRGFCEHYATSFALLMRLAGIPSRVVVGYQGGEINPHGGHLIVRQSDAHAWNEVWLPEIGWQRVDPTGAVAPERIEKPIQVDQQTDGAAITFEIDNGMMRRLWRNAGWLADSMQLGWHRWVVNYSARRQQHLLRELGLGDLGGYAQALAAVFGAFVALGIGTLLFLVRGRRRRGDRLRRAYRRLLDKLRRAGVDLPDWLGPVTARDRAIAALPEQATRLRVLFDAYVALRYGRLRARYGRLGARAMQRRFEHGVSRFRPGRKGGIRGLLTRGSA